MGTRCAGPLGCRSQGAAIQVRLYAEDPALGYRPSSGTLTEVAFPPDIRVDGWVAAGTEVSAFYDPMLAKLIVTAPDRPAAVAKIAAALDATPPRGIETNLDWLRTVVRSPRLHGWRGVDERSGGHRPIRPGRSGCWRPARATTVQDYPGRLGYWSVGVPPSGPMDALSFRIGNRLLGNPEGSAGLEITAAGPALPCSTRPPASA